VSSRQPTIQRKIVFTNVNGDNGDFFLQRFKRDKFADLLNSAEIKFLEMRATDNNRYPFVLSDASILEIAYVVRGARENLILENLETLRASRQREVKKLKKSKLVSSFLGLEDKQAAPKTRTVKVGVTFRTDAKGEAHVTHDKKAIAGIKALPGLAKLLGLEKVKLTELLIEAVTLPKGAKGGDTPVRTATWADLNDIDLLYIPGAPTANDQQVGTNSEESLFNKPQEPPHPGEAPKAPELEAESTKAAKGRNAEKTRLHKKATGEHQTKLSKYQKDHTTYLRVLNEHRSRAAYELKLIGIAKERGIPVLAVCAGSWRLLESYGGQVETLPKAERDVHKAAQPQDTWTLSHGITVEKPTAKQSTMLARLMNKKAVETVLTDVNSTHWAVASIDKTGKLVQNLEQSKLGNKGKQPSQLLEVSAKASGQKVKVSTVEAFESRYGAPTLGIQWHPETALPEMLGEKDGSQETRTASTKIFEFMTMAALTSQRRRTGVVAAIESIGNKLK
jgi:putative glutamine amidotransferase